MVIGGIELRLAVGNVESLTCSCDTWERIYESPDLPSDMGIDPKVNLIDHLLCSTCNHRLFNTVDQMCSDKLDYEERK